MLHCFVLSHLSPRVRTTPLFFVIDFCGLFLSLLALSKRQFSGVVCSWERRHSILLALFGEHTFFVSYIIHTASILAARVIGEHSELQSAMSH